MMVMLVSVDGVCRVHMCRKSLRARGKALRTAQYQNRWVSVLLTCVLFELLAHVYSS